MIISEGMQCVQWNISNQDTSISNQDNFGTVESVLISEVS